MPGVPHTVEALQCNGLGDSSPARPRVEVLRPVHPRGCPVTRREQGLGEAGAKGLGEAVIAWPDLSDRCLASACPTPRKSFRICE